MFTEEQKEYIVCNLRRPENEIRISQIAFDIAEELRKTGVDIESELVKQTAMLMNLGETDPRISYIYDSEYNWKEHPEAIKLNKLHGKYSVEMAENNNIKLSEEQKRVIAGHSKGDYTTLLGEVIKIAEICRATESTRWYRGEKKAPANSWKEVQEILSEDELIKPQLIAIAENSYGRKQFKKTNNKEENENIR